MGRSVYLVDIIRCEQLSKIYNAGEGRVAALDGVTLAFEKGAFTAITGPSGSGKSTLLHLLGGLDTPTSGKVYYQDEELYKYRDNQLSVLRRRRFGFVFQSYNLVRELTAWENILLPVMLDHRKCDQSYLDGIIEILGIGDRLSHLPGAMSGGQQQRVCIARALANKPSILFADEPTGNLDYGTSREILALIQGICRERGTTLIMVTHDPEFEQYADHVIHLLDGRLVEPNDRAQHG